MKMKNFSVEICARMSQLLGHGCAPSTARFKTIAGLARAMKKRKREYNSSLSLEETWRSIDCWELSEQGKIGWCTGSGRMWIEADDNAVQVDFSSPLTNVFLSIEITAKELRVDFSTDEEGWLKKIQDLLSEGETGRWDRVSGVFEYLIPAVGGTARFIELVPNEGKQAMFWLELIRGYLLFVEISSLTEKVNGSGSGPMEMYDEYYARRALCALEDGLTMMSAMHQKISSSM